MLVIDVNKILAGVESMYMACSCCGLSVNYDKYPHYVSGTPCPDPACPSYNREEWDCWPGVDFTPVLLIDGNFETLSAKVKGFKEHIRKAKGFEPVDFS